MKARIIKEECIVVLLEWTWAYWTDARSNRVILRPDASSARCLRSPSSNAREVCMPPAAYLESDILFPSALHGEKPRRTQLHAPRR